MKTNIDNYSGTTDVLLSKIHAFSLRMYVFLFAKKNGCQIRGKGANGREKMFFAK
ncbi:hypothetical protein M2101_002384 [Parabacteroides sp. PM5-20]|uniref:hypothetical protein n=1 Tax=unclassified Parabacteroides TaxID=2649774 RepID=UPI0013D47D0B|nr:MULTISPECIES: hypothetical protein [unclassified Parabacteroides]MDH6535695.1 hypothetical protein [Parabacteroides sp. PM5-20]